VGLQELAVAVQQMVAPAGVKLEVKTVPWSVFNANVYKKKALYVNNWFGRATIDETVYPYFHARRERCCALAGVSPAWGIVGVPQ
jgi:ABC-type transport system substrate-binding protein